MPKTRKNSSRGRSSAAKDDVEAPRIPADYAERVYAGVLGKIIGVYLGRPIEGWLHRDILAKFGEINYYVHEQRGVPLVVADDDISGTFTFIRALEDHGNNKGITPADIGQSWLNYIIETRAILWWGGMGSSTEHTAFLRLKHGMRAPHSGSIATNGKVVAEQIGAQIFIDGWAMVAPGDPELAASLAQRAASVSHDGEAVYAAQIVAAMEALAFVEKDIGKILDGALAFIPQDSVIFRMIDELRSYQQKVPIDWKKAFAEVLEKSYGYDKFGGGCHAVPNHGIIILALLYGQNDFQHSLMIANTCGWDTDCNSGNVGCFMGIKNGLAGIEAGPDWRNPVSDKLYLPTADAGSCMSDAVTQTYKIVNMGRALAGEEAVNPKDGARFHFSLPGSVQGFVADESAECAGVISEIFNAGQSLAVVFRSLATGRLARVGVATFLTPDLAKMPGYSIIASPTIYPGQRVRARVALRSDIELTARIYWKHLGQEDQTVILRGPEVALTEEHQVLEWNTPFTGGQPITEVGLELSSARSVAGVIDIDFFTWDGEPDVTLLKLGWANGASILQEAPKSVPEQQLVLIQNEGRGLAMQGTRQWKNYRVAADVTPHMAAAAGIAARVQGMQRYYALLLCNDGKIKLVKVLDDETVLGEVERVIELDRAYRLELQMNGSAIRATMDSELLFEVNDFQRPLLDGAVGLVVEEGRCAFGPVAIKPA